MSTKVANTLSLGLAFIAIGLVGFKNYNRDSGAQFQILNASYDPTREVYTDIDSKFVDKYEKDSGQPIGVKQSHAGSSRQAKRVADGSLDADVVTLALPSDIGVLSQHGLVASDWQTKFPHNAQPYNSTIVFVVRKGNPKNIKDWPDLTASGVEVVTPNPKTSGNGKLSVLAAWGSVIYRGGTEDQARDYVTKLYQNAAVLGAGSRDATNIFTLGHEGDVHLTWENEAIREVAASKGDLQIVYPPVSILAEPSVAVVQANATKHKAEAASNAYLKYLYSDEAQEIFAQDGYRPTNADILKKHQDTLPSIDLFPITAIAKDWDDAQEKFFSDSGIFESIHPTKTN